MLKAVRLSKSRKFGIVASPIGINGKLNLIKSTGEKFVVLEFEDAENNLHARRIYFTEKGKFTGISPKELEALIGNTEIEFGQFVTRDGVTHFMFTNDLESEDKMAKVFAKNAYLYLDE